MKGDSQNCLELKTIDDNNKVLGKLEKAKKVFNGVGVTTIVKRIIEQRDLKGQKHFHLLEIITEPNFLEKYTISLVTSWKNAKWKFVVNQVIWLRDPIKRPYKV